MTPRLQAKIPKFFGWQLCPGYDYYLWHDANIVMPEGRAEELVKECEGYDMVVYRHYRRPNIRQENRYYRKGMNQQSIYMLERYTGEWTAEIYDIVQADKTYTDDLLFMGGVFLYRDTPEVRDALKEWWYYTTRYTVMDQLAFPYVTRHLKRKILEWDYEIKKHKLRK